MSLYRTPKTSGATKTPTTPSPATSTAAAQDAARTFIKRPETKRRSLDNRETYNKRQNDYAAMSSDLLLQGLLKTFEDIPSKVQEYPQMRRDIKQFLEAHSDKGMRVVFELSARMQRLEAKGPKTETLTSKGQDEVIKKLGEMEATLTERISEMEKTIQTDLQGLDVSANDRGSDLKETIGEKLADVEQMTTEVESRLHDRLEKLAEEVVAARHETVGPATYASIAAARPARRPALHSVAVTFESGLETADQILARVKKAVDARGTGLKINKVRKAKNQTVIIGCDTEEERNKVQNIIEKRGNGLKAAPMRNKDPLVILRDVHNDSDDEDLKNAIFTQNREIFYDIPEEDIEELNIKYKKRTRNPNTVHIILQVRPAVWRRMTEAGALYLDLQRVRVEDQSPLIQCTRCLAFGHGRKFCTGGADMCSHCGGPHLREKCADYVAGKEPRCCNCSRSGLQGTDHNAFSIDCPERKKWDYLARANTAYA
ncbi:unnamed protein product [Arctia plantaginis]|uniref:Gag-like protein n=1 Tax=Arctia plantaginis TaxID=874455 RepID=A0A8S0Z6C6_ARCPL|nr:unnamed protein product [Arctia plantaginis]